MSRTVNAPDEPEVVRRAQIGDPAAFADLYRRYRPRIDALVRRMTHCDQDAEDLTQDIFLQAYRSLGEFQGRSTFYTWLYRIAANTCLLYRKRTRRHPEAIPIDETQHGPEAETERRERLTAIRNALAHLPVPQRLVLVLGPIQGHSYEEIGSILGVSVDMVKGRLHRARRNLHRLVDENASRVRAA